MKEWECVQVEDYKNIGAVTKGRQQHGWRLHTYCCTQKVLERTPIITCCLKRTNETKQILS